MCLHFPSLSCLVGSRAGVYFLVYDLQKTVWYDAFGVSNDGEGGLATVGTRTVCDIG